ncbi:MAG TPA: RDD family protein [Blastocatellia bacterium]
MIGAAIICRACNHNNALTRRLAWRRAEPRHRQSTLSRPSGPSTGFPTIVPRKDNDVNLLHFPSSLKKKAEAAPAQQARAENQSQAEVYPPWRAELKERVRRIKEKRATNDLAPPNPHAHPLRAQAGEIKFGRNPIVEAALKRIRWSPRESAREKDARRDEGMEEWRDGKKKALSVSPPFRLSVPSSLRLSVLPSRASSQTSTGKAAIGRQLAGAPSKQPDKPPNRQPNKQADKQSRARLAEVAQVHEPPEPKADPASLQARLLAGACDFEIVLVAFLLIFAAYQTSNDASSSVYGSRLLVTLLLSAVVFTYQIVTLAFAGRTFGMALLKLNLVNAGDESLPVTPWQKLLRASTATIVFICFPLYLTAWFSVSRRTLPDLVSGTTVA